MLTANVAHFAENPVPLPPADMTGEDRVVYRWFAAHGFQFHPLASFATLNSHAKNQRREEAGQLAKAMVARSVKEGRTLTWEYYFPFAGPGRWTSAPPRPPAHRRSRGPAPCSRTTRFAGAGATYREIARDLSQSLGGGTWVKEYSYSDMAVLNAQLQSIVSSPSMRGSRRTQRRSATSRASAQPPARSYPSSTRAAGRATRSAGRRHPTVTTATT